MQKQTAPTAANSESWSIDTSVDNVPQKVRERYQQIENDAVGWSTRLVDFQSDQRGNSTDLAAVLHRVDAWREGENDSDFGIKQMNDATDYSNIDPKTAGQTIRTKSGQNILRGCRLSLAGWPGSI